LTGETRRPFSGKRRAVLVDQDGTLIKNAPFGQSAAGCGTMPGARRTLNQLSWARRPGAIYGDMAGPQGTRTAGGSIQHCSRLGATRCSRRPRPGLGTRTSASCRLHYPNSAATSQRMHRHSQKGAGTTYVVAGSLLHSSTFLRASKLQPGRVLVGLGLTNQNGPVDPTVITHTGQAAE
jgi:hypothetical protein